MALQTPPVPSATQALQMGMKYGPTTGVALQRSQYLADALRQLQDSGSDIRTPGELGSKLLATAITTWAKNKADKGAMEAYGADRTHMIDNATAGTPLGKAAAAILSPERFAPETSPGGPGLDPSAAAPTAAVAPPPVPVQTEPLAAAQPPPTDADGLWAAVKTQESGNRPGVTGPATAYGRAQGLTQMLPRTAQAMATKLGVPWQPDMMTGTTPEAAAYQDKLGRAYFDEGMQAGSGDPRQALMHYYGGPDQKMWGPKTHAYADQVMARVGSGQSPPPDMGAPQPPGPGDGSFQIASNGPSVPFPAQPPAGASPPPAAGGAPLAAGPSPAAGGQSSAAPREVVTPEEWEVARGLINSPYPDQQDKGIELVQQLKLRAASMPKAPEKMYWGPDGRVHADPGTETVQLQGASPSDSAQRDAFSNVSHSTIPGVQGSVPDGMVLSNGQYVRVQQPTTWSAPHAVPGAEGLYQTNTVTGESRKAADQPYGPAQLIEMRDKVISSEPVKLYQQAQDAYGAMVAAAKLGPGGMRAYALRDTFARAINPGAVARSGTIEAIKQSQGLPANVKAYFMNMQGDGDVPPEIAQQILDVTQGFVSSHYAGAKALNDSNAEYAKRHGFDPTDIQAPIGDAPQRFVITAPSAAGGNPADTLQQARAAIAQGAPRDKVIERLTQAGINPAGL